MPNTQSGYNSVLADTQKMRLTDEAIAKRKRPKEGQQFDWDELVSGFGVRFTPSATTFVVQWREADGSKSRESLGPRWADAFHAGGPRPGT